MSEKSVFISYSMQDRSWLRAFATALRDRNVNVRLDELDLTAGDDWEARIRTVIRESEVIIAVISDAPSENPNVYFDMGAAWAANKRLILVVDPSAATSLPLELGQERLVALQTPEETAREVVEAISAPG